jgi:hypothetical protein
VGEVGTGLSQSASYNLYAGYQQMDTERYISLTILASTTLNQNISGFRGGLASSTAYYNVKTDNPYGYALSIAASTSPAMVRVGGSDYIFDYTPAGSNPDYAWGILATSSAYGFTPQGSDVATPYLSAGALCNQTGGTSVARTCWDGFNTVGKTISKSSAGNDPAGSTTTLYLQAEIGTQRMQPSGTYHSTMTVTAIMN